MRKLWFRRKAVSTMVGGIIILSIFFIALVAMVVLSQQYDTYQATAEEMQQKQIDLYAENFLASYPGIMNGTGTQAGSVWQVDCIGSVSTCNNYTLVVNNLGIGSQVVRLYIASSVAGCDPCVLDPARPASPDTGVVSRFRASDGYVNPGEYSHNVVFWLPSTIPLTGCTNSSECKVSLVTARGRVFSFLWPFPTAAAPATTGSGGTGIYIGPLVITFQKELITYTTDTVSIPPIPIGGDNGYWVLPSKSGGSTMIIYIKIQTDINVTNDVYLTPQSVFEIARFDNPGQLSQFFVIAPITPTFCQTGFKYNSNYNKDLLCGLTDSNGHPVYQSSGNTGSLSIIVPYQACGKPPNLYSTCTGRYVIPKPTALGERGPPVIVAFAVSSASGTSPTKTVFSDVAVTSYLGLSYVYENVTGAGPYLYGVTLPFIAGCVGPCTAY
jgi:hypothetical protein